MKAIIQVIAFLACAGLVHAQPANDHFTNRIVLAGNSVTFVADLTRASIESGEPWNPCLGSSAGRSVWYAWRADETAPVLVQLLSATGTSSPYSFNALVVYNSSEPPEAGFATFIPLKCTALTSISDHAYLGFQANSGTTYYIQVVVGLEARTFEFQLEVSRIPQILEHPRDVTLNPGATALFKTTTLSATPWRYQWRKGLIALQDENSSMLVVSNVTVAEVGEYSVIISNETGSVTSQVAQLRVEPPANRPVLRLGPGPSSNTASLSFTGDMGRSYRVESSFDLLGWAPETVLYRTPPGSVVIQTAADVSVAVSSSAARKFFRVATYHAVNSLCEANLKRIRHAKELWARDAGKQPSDTPTLMDLRPYYKGSMDPRCPGGGFYAMNALDTQPACSLSTHRLEEPR